MICNSLSAAGISMESRVAEFWGAPDLSVQIGGGASERHDAVAPKDDMDWAFGLTTPELRLFTTGLKQRLTPGPAATLGARVRRFFADLPVAPETDEPSPRLLVGALPFDRSADDCLFLPERAANRIWDMPSGAHRPAIRALTPEPS
ncbi:MAG TPA: isochorismate synthase, partial [Brevundimonas sp.]|nr:isochorismate synthase [Brevundimonas sp.]